MSAPPGSAYEYWAIGAGATFTNGASIGTWTGQALGDVLTLTSGGTSSYDSATGMIHLTANGGYLGTGQYTLTQPYSMAVYLDADSGVVNIGNVFNSTSNLNASFFTNGGGQCAQTSDNTNTIVWNTPAINTGTQFTVMWVFNGSSAKCYVNGLSQTINSGTTVGTTNLSNSVFQVNGASGGNNGVSLRLGSVVLYNNDASANAAAIDTWLRAQPPAASTTGQRARGRHTTTGGNFAPLTPGGRIMGPR
jgi:hypothetical protein